MKVGIVGGGPVGCYCGYLLASKGFHVDIFEEDKDIGKPVQCTGIVTRKILGFINIEPLNVVNKVRVHSENKSIDLRLQDNLVIDRAAFDLKLAEMASKAGARINTGCKVDKISRKGVYAPKLFDCDIIIGADGPGSIVAKYIGVNRRFWKGVQARVRAKNDNAVDFYLNKGVYSWKVPESDKVVRVGGLATKKQVEELIEGEVLEWQGGLIPKYDSKQPIQKNNIYLVGDAAGQVKATTGGGLVPGLLACEDLADSIVCGRKYKGVGLWTHLKIREVLDRFDPDDYDKLLVLCDRRVQRILSRYSRDDALRLVFHLILVQPRFLGFLGKVF